MDPSRFLGHGKIWWNLKPLTIHRDLWNIEIHGIAHCGLWNFVFSAFFWTNKFYHRRALFWNRILKPWYLPCNLGWRTTQIYLEPEPGTWKMTLVLLGKGHLLGGLKPKKTGTNRFQVFLHVKLPTRSFFYANCVAPPPRWVVSFHHCAFWHTFLGFQSVWFRGDFLFSGVCQGCRSVPCTFTETKPVFRWYGSKYWWVPRGPGGWNFLGPNLQPCVSLGDRGKGVEMRNSPRMPSSIPGVGHRLVRRESRWGPSFASPSNDSTISHELSGPSKKGTFPLYWKKHMRPLSVCCETIQLFPKNTEYFI